MMETMDLKPRFHLRLPGTSANLGPAFDTAAVALNLHLDITAQPAKRFSISAQGRDREACGKLEQNLILETYRRVLAENGRPVHALQLEVKNEIPLGMGCGSSAAARLAGIALAIEFGELGWRDEEIVATGANLEGHPDNVTACWLGGMTVSAVSSQKMVPNMGNCSPIPRVHVARFATPEHWTAVLIFPREPLRTEESRKLLPSHYSRADVVKNLQHCALLVAAFASGNSDLLRAAMRDRLHQPYRSAICPLLLELQPLAAIPGVLGVALSGAGPSILLIVEQNLGCAALDRMLRATLADLDSLEVIHCGFVGLGADSSVSNKGSKLPIVRLD